MILIELLEELEYEFGKTVLLAELALLHGLLQFGFKGHPPFGPSHKGLHIFGFERRQRRLDLEAVVLAVSLVFLHVAFLCEARTRQILGVLDFVAVLWQQLR